MSPVWLDDHLDPIDIQWLDDNDDIVAEGKLLFFCLCVTRLGHRDRPVIHLLIPALQGLARGRAAPSSAHLFTYGIEKLASPSLPLNSRSLKSVESRAVGGITHRGRDGVLGCSKNASGSRDSELVRSSVDPLGEFDGVRVSYCWFVK